MAILIATLAMAAGGSAQDLGSAESAEYLIKAGYVYNFAKLVEWPGASSRKGQPMVIGVLGNDAFATVLDRVVSGKKIDERPFVVKRLRNYRECGCQILFVSAGEAGRTDEIVQFQNSTSVLTVAETPDFTKRGGVIALVLEDSRVRFMVNVDAAAQASLTVSSRLLALATVVHTGR